MASARALALAAAGTAMVGALVFPAVASAAEPAAPGGFAVDHLSWGQHWDAPGDWHHPEWGPGWNDGYPAPGWVPPAGWAPPMDWVPPVGWAPPAGWAAPAGWIPPCQGPLFALFHPIRCA